MVEKIELLNDLLITLSPSSLDDACPLDPPLTLYNFRTIVSNIYTMVVLKCLIKLTII